MNPASTAWFETVNSAARAQLLSILPSWLPGGRRVGREFRCGSLNGDAGRSFSVNLETGVWTDFAGGAPGGHDPISLYAAIHHLRQGEAADQLGPMLGLTKPKHLRAVKDTWTPITPAPAGKPAPSWWPDGTPADGWLYTDAEGHPLCWRVRFDLPGGDKEVRPLTWCRAEDGRCEWRWKDLPAPRPLYNLLALAQRPAARVLVVEGEKTAEAASRLLSAAGWVITTWPGGAKRVATADWTPLRGRDVWIWPDNDDPGKRAVLEIAAILEKL